MEHLINNLTPLPIQLVRGFGGYVRDTESNRYLDWYNDNGVISLGYDDPAVASAVNREHAKGLFPHVPQMYPHPLRTRVAAKVCEAVGLDKVYFGTGGTEAVETAIKAARLRHFKDGSKHKNFILSLPGQYHGRTGYAMAANQSAAYHKEGFGPMPKGFACWDIDARRISFQEEDGGGFLSTHWDASRLNDAAYAFFKERVAAVIYAPVLGNNVIRAYPMATHATIRELADACNFAVIHDDVQAGAGRAGAYATWQTGLLKPDMVCLGKGIAAGHPLSATVMAERYASAFTPGTHFYTFGGSSVASLAAAEVVLDWLAENPARPDWIGAQLAAMLDEAPGLDRVWHEGALVAAMPRYDEFNITAWDVFEACRKRGLLLVNFRPKNELKIIPRLNATDKELRHGASMFKKAMADLSGGE